MPRQQLKFKKIGGWGGRRRGAGRPNKSGHAGHLKREKVDFKKPLHITLKLKEKMPQLRTKAFLKQFKIAIKIAKAFGLHVIHYSLLNNHIHMIIEARNNNCLERGMKSLCGRLGKLIRKLRGGSGSVWAARFHLHVMRTPTEVKRALEYVLLNAAKHARMIEHLDDFSSGYAFKSWAHLLKLERISGLMREQFASYGLIDHPELCAPQSWLLNQGWKRARPL